MKKLYFSLFIFCLSFNFYGQIINIPDANFKNYLLTQNTVETNGDWIPDAVADANQDGEIDQNEALAVTIIWPNSLQITDLTGLEYFTNVTFLDFSGNFVTAVDLHTLHHLKTVRCNNNLLTEINLCGTVATILYAENNPNLTYISIKNNVISTWSIGRNSLPNTPPGPPSFQFPISLQTLCCDVGEEGAFFVESNVVVTTDCVLDCGENPNRIAGNVKYDLAGNGCDASDIGASIPIKITKNGIPSFRTYSAGGRYSAITYDDNLTLTPQFSNPYYTISPATANTTYAGTGNVENIDFCITPNAVFPDLSVNLVTGTPPRPGFDTLYFMYYKNKGTVPLSGQVTLNFDDTRLDYLGADPAVASISEGLITWDFNNMAPFETRYISFKMNVNAPSETPPVNVGDLLDFSAHINLNAATDSNPDDNQSNLTQVVRGSFDPNDISVSSLITQIEPPMEYLTYTIRFQNTGNEAAEKVRITDRLDERFDKSTLEIIGASHPYRATLEENNKLEFTFDNINLPDSTSDEPGSHGYVSFKIKPIEGSMNSGESMANEAKIYFDFNLPILTNSATTAYYTLLGTQNYDKNVVTLYPNPAKNLVNVVVSKGAYLKSVTIYNTLGQLVKTIDNHSAEKNIAIDVASLKSGTYFIEVDAEQGKSTKKFIKL
ncbi:T9SS type A sorting domain-containing protein [Flavobacterium sp.]|uniref:T9SS type A sorting domain-containing protein n=1 Tax=Flavobacterium sp. TaxID=239 RepID=UPI00262D4F6F|nr:T9SS type A sorting domain-containing protein [Flavobacterium sp.]